MTGTGLVSSADSRCKFGATTVPMTVVNTTLCTCTSPAASNALSPVALDIALNGANFTSSGLVFYYYNVTALSPDIARGPVTGATPVYLRVAATGTVNHPGHVAMVRFTSAANPGIVLTVPGTVITDPLAPSGFSVLFSSPSVASYSLLYPASFAIALSLNGGAQYVPPSASFEYYDTPAITGLSLVGIPADATNGVTVTLLGSGFRNYPQIYCRVTPSAGQVMTLPAAFDVPSGLIWVSLPSLASGTPSATLSSLAGPAVFEVSLNDRRQFTSNGRSLSLFAVVGVSPAGGPLLGGTQVTVSGLGFVPTSLQCKFGGSTSPASYLSPFNIACTAPAAGSGLVSVGVSMDSIHYSSSSASAPSTTAQYLYYATPDFKSLVPPAAIVTSSGLFVTVYGAGFPALSVNSIGNSNTNSTNGNANIARCRFGAVVTTASSSFSGDPTSNNLSGVVCPLPTGQIGIVNASIAFNGVDFEPTGLAFEFIAPQLVCAAGYAPDPLAGKCVACPAGSYSADGSACQPCPKGKYSAANASASCDICSAGFISAGPGSTACTPCAAGSHAPTNESSACTPCPPGRFSATEGSPTCSVCTIGSYAGGQGSLSCTPCLSGSYSSSNESTVCTPCPPGQFASANSSTACEVCPIGTFARTPGTSSCAPCPRGSFGVGNGSVSCPQCSVAEYSDAEASLACKLCPTGTFSIGVPSSAESCTCKPGFFEPSLGAGFPCKACPNGGLCPGGNGTESRPLPVAGYWASSESPFTFIRCEPPSACPGGKFERCAEGYTGRMCSQCVNNWFKAGGECRPCPKGSPAILAGFVLFAFVIALLLIKAAGKSARAYSGTVGIATKFFQVLAVIGKLDVSWPPRIKDAVTTITTPFSLKVDALAPECSAPAIAYGTKWGMTMLLPLFFLVVFGLVYVGAWLRARFLEGRPLSKSYTNRVINAYLSLLSLGFLTLASTAIEPFGCRLDKDQKYTLVADPSKLCFDPWWRALAGFAVAGVLVYVVGIPLALFWWLRRNRDRLSDPDFVERYGGIYSSYVPGLPHWEAIVMVEKIAVAATGLLMSGFVVLQIIFLQLIFVVTLSLYQAKTPYIRGKDNLLHAQLRWCSLLVLCAGMVFKMNDFPNPTARTAIEVVALALIVGGTAVVVGSVAWNLWRIRQSLRVEIGEELEGTLSLFSPHGRTVLTRWLRKAAQSNGGGLQTKLQHVLQSVKRLCDAAKPPSKDPAAKKVPRAMAYDDVPLITDDPTSDAIVATFCGGTFRDDLIPIVRTWVDQQSQSSPAQLRSFTECFSALGRFSRDQEQSRAKSTTTSERLARNVTNRLTRRSSKRLSSVKRPSSSVLVATGSHTSDPLPHGQDHGLERPLTLLKTLYGPKLASYASETPELIDSAEFLMGIQAFYLVADPKANLADDRGKVFGAVATSASASASGEGPPGGPPRGPSGGPPTPARSPPALPELPPPPIGDFQGQSSRSTGQSNTDLIEIEMTELGPEK